QDTVSKREIVLSFKEIIRRFMKPKALLSLGKFLACLALVLTASAALALDARYKDADGDLVADAPPATETIDPPVLIFAYTPVEDPAVYAKVWDEFLKNMEK